MNAQKNAPTAALGHKTMHEQSYRVWSRSPAYLEDAKPWKCVAAFRYLQEALDYIAYLQDNRVDCVFQSPADCKPILHTDRRVVYKPEPVGDFELSGTQSRCLRSAQ